MSEQLKVSNDSRFKLKSKLDDALASKSAAEEAAQSEQQRLTFALEEMRAEMEVLKAIYQVAPRTLQLPTRIISIPGRAGRCEEGGGGKHACGDVAAGRAG